MNWISVLYKLGFLFILAIGPLARAQDSFDSNDDSEKKDTGLSLTAFSYPIFLNGETHSEFSLLYPLDEKFEAELKGFYDTYILADVTRFAFRMKYYPSAKFYINSGMAGELERDKIRGNVQPPRLFLLNGAGYDINNRLNMEVKHELLFNKNATGNYGLPSVLSVHGKYRF